MRPLFHDSLFKLVIFPITPLSGTPHFVIASIVSPRLPSFMAPFLLISCWIFLFCHISGHLLLLFQLFHWPSPVQVADHKIRVTQTLAKPRRFHLIWTWIPHMLMQLLQHNFHVHCHYLTYNSASSHSLPYFLQCWPCLC